MVDDVTKKYLEELVESPFTKRIDTTTTANTVYIGKGTPASAEGDNTWQIKKITTSAGITDITWADGNAKYDNIWTNRASATYS